jgi:hypothetical protein
MDNNSLDGKKVVRISIQLADSQIFKLDKMSTLVDKDEDLEQLAVSLRKDVVEHKNDYGWTKARFKPYEFNWAVFSEAGDLLKSSFNWKAYHQEI